ncbi:MAG: hypothetical protein ACE5IK_13715, partial [Acidobacteriota bacterium]
MRRLDRDADGPREGGALRCRVDGRWTVRPAGFVAPRRTEDETCVGRCRDRAAADDRDLPLRTVGGDFFVDLGVRRSRTVSGLAEDFFGVVLDGGVVLVDL